MWVCPVWLYHPYRLVTIRQERWRLCWQYMVQQIPRCLLSLAGLLSPHPSSVAAASAPVLSARWQMLSLATTAASSWRGLLAAPSPAAAASAATVPAAAAAATTCMAATAVRKDGVSSKAISLASLSSAAPSASVWYIVTSCGDTGILLHFMDSDTDSDHKSLLDVMMTHSLTDYYHPDRLIFIQTALMSITPYL